MLVIAGENAVLLHQGIPPYTETRRYIERVLALEVSASAAKRAWARLIKQVYEVDPLVCPRCAGPMRLIAFIEQREVIDLPVPGTCLPPACRVRDANRCGHAQAGGRQGRS